MSYAVLHLPDGWKVKVRPLVGASADEMLLYLPGFVRAEDLEGAVLVLEKGAPPVEIDSLDLRTETTSSVIRVKLRG
ncbi:MAG: hypothetical protein A2Y64_02805 [Candidatus Coatesbacteria bacterium RBG_13_66_14]|uniref:Uncharacterized protein n=1 Tax=Candidatus Coatesbacteria bacterium RBG_13_66_14 TaxID=1817816 RepID=A0A1F5F5I1_9BACT|nr:MAG: hypothetical protein A2Y64_02805 [Candidatus Coatesbacteria bacterium RBG_13_66_14]